MYKLLKTIIILVLVGFVLLISAIYWTGYQKSDLVKADGAVVFGAAQYNGQPSPIFAARLDHAKTLYDLGLVSKIVVTGGRGREADLVSEGRAGRNYLVDHNIPAEVIRFEEASHTTQENLFELKKILDQEQIKTVIFVSDRFHMFRISILAKKFNFNYQLSPTTTSPVERNRLEELKFVWRELQIYFRYLIFGV